MSLSLYAHFLPSLIDRERLAGKTVVVIDVLRATTTLVQALESGAQAIIPCETIDEARRTASELDGRVLLGGERGGRAIDGFDLANSPAEYTFERVSGATIVFTTTNGTRAMKHGRDARRLLIGAFVNLTSLCGSLPQEGEVHLLCAGTHNTISHEDVLLAGAIIGRLSKSALAANDQAMIAHRCWLGVQSLETAGAPLARLLNGSRGSRNLTAIGQAADVDLAGRIDGSCIVPELDPVSWRIRLP